MDRSELQARLADDEPVTVLDIRAEEAYEAWRIPGSHNLPVIDRVQDGDNSALDDLEADEEPVVTVCGRGKAASQAAEALRDCDIDARTLEGGMRAWSLAWNAAEATIPGAEARLV
jgi:rhodanese-related sulfurtransferase